MAKNEPVRSQTRAFYILPACYQNLSQSIEVGAHLRQGLRYRLQRSWRSKNRKLLHREFPKVSWLDFVFFFKKFYYRNVQAHTKIVILYMNPIYLSLSLIILNILTI